MLSIRPEHAQRIYAGTKRAELRKAFPQSARLVFLYETAPVSAVTGAFIVRDAVRANVATAVSLASAAGVEEANALAYYGERSNGWVVNVGAACKFRDKFPLAELIATNHYFAVPQTFAYLPPFEALTQVLLARFADEMARIMRLRPMSDRNADTFRRLVRAEVGTLYDDIDDDFLEQVLDETVGLDGAFSTKTKRVFEVTCADELLGFTVLTEKVYGAWKSGPTILLPLFRRLGMGQALRTRITTYCRDRGAIGLYCTCAESQPAVVSYLLNSGMKLQARLRRHLSPDRDELVFSTKFFSNGLPTTGRSRRTASDTVSIQRVRSTNSTLERVIGDFVRMMPEWYFLPSDDLADSIHTSLTALEAGSDRYSAKGRTIHAAINDLGRSVVVVLGTMKRSNMVKLNLVAGTDNSEVIRRTVVRALKDWKSARRVYLTTPTTAGTAIRALASAGFVFEGVLQNPFGAGVDHACFGLVGAALPTSSHGRPIKKRMQRRKRRR